MKPKILIADDHQLFNDGIKGLLSDDFEIVAQVFDGKHVLPNILKFLPDLTLLDINLPSIKGLELASQIKANFTKIKVVMLTMYNEPAFIELAQKIPVDGYLLKDSSKTELISGLKASLNGEIFYDKKLQTAKINLHHDDEFVKRFALSPREIEIIKHIKNGISSKQIADLLHLSEETIKSHRKNIHFKLGINKVSELVQFAVKNGI